MTRSLVLIAISGLALSACRTTSKAPEFQPVAQEDMGRLTPQQMAPVDAARQELFQARDELARAKLRLGQAGRQQGFVDAELAAAEADRKHAEALREAAEASREPQKLAAAEQAAATAQLRTQAADARRDAVQDLIAAREAEVRADEARVAALEARVEASKLTALRQAGVPAATKYDETRFQQHVTDAQAAASKAQADFETAMAAARQSESEWRALSEQLRVREQGTASGGR